MAGPSIPQKRPLENEVEPSIPTQPSISTPVKVAIRSEASTPLSVLSVQTPSPMKSLTQDTTTNAPSSSANPLSSQPAPTSSATTQPAKRRKLTQKEKDEQKAEKEAKAKTREEKKAQKEAEEKLKAEQKAAREEEKRLKDEEKQKKIEEREEKRRQKEEEQQHKEEEKAKKERSQMRLNVFFAKPKGAAVSPAKALVESTHNTPASSASLSSEPSGAITNPGPRSPQKNIVQNAQSDYEKYFLPFSLPAHTILAPRNAFMEDPAKCEAAQARLEKIMAQSDANTVTLDDFKKTRPSSGCRGVSTPTIVDVVEHVNSSSDRPIDLTGDKQSSRSDPTALLKKIPMKYIHFGEDVRPPYYGTYTRSYTQAESMRLARNPTARVRQDTNYDYDSEAEWDEPEDGEDLDQEDDDEEEDAEDDMEGFLDDEEDPQLKRRLISGDLQPISTGLCWQDEQGLSRLNDGSDAICTDFRDFSIGFLLQASQPRSIDPFSSAYWAPEPSLVAPTVKKEALANGSMNPPRAPLTQRTVNGLLNTLNTPQQATGSASKPAKPKRMIPDEHLAAFKQEVEGKDLTKIGMIEALKKVFPKIPKDAITNTLSVVAARVGPTEKEKRWVLVNN